MFNLADALTRLERTPDSLRALMVGLPDQWLFATEGPDEWSPYQVLCHLVNGEYTNWLLRAQHILAGEPRPFAPFDRTGLPAELHGKSADDLLAVFAHMRRDNVAALRRFNLSDADLARIGQHPEFGTVTLAQLLATWVVHDLNHLAQITRTLAKVYTVAVGPWRAYLDILD